MNNIYAKTVIKNTVFCTNYTQLY